MTETIKRVYENKNTGQKLVCIPKTSSIKPGDYVKIIKMESEQ